MEVIEKVVVVGDKNVIRDLYQPKLLGTNGRPILRGLIAPGGSKAGVTGGQRFCAFEEAGISASHFDKGLFTSATAFNGIAYAAKQSHMLSEYYQKMSWFNPGVLWSLITRGDYLGMMWLMDELRSVLDEETFRKCQMDITIAVSDLQGKAHLHNAKQADDIYDLMLASAAILPDVYGRKIKDVYSVDGGFTIDSTVVKWLKAIQRENENRSGSRRQNIDLLYIANRPHPRLHFSNIEEYLFNKFVRWTLEAKYPELARGARTLDIKFRKLSDYFEKQRPLVGIRTCALFPMPDEDIHSNEWRKKILRTRGELTRIRTHKLLCALAPKREI